MMTMRRANLPGCTISMLDVLKRLRDHQDEHGYLFLSLDDVHGRTINALMDRDWITIRPMDGKYTITYRGVRACEVYETPSEEYDGRRWDGICCRCGERERGYYSNGKKRPYCAECENKLKKRARKLFGHRRPGICPDCNERQKHIAKSGKIRSYCKPCRRKRSKQYREDRNRREIERVRAGEVLLCYKCHEQPRYLTANTLQDYCRDCMLEDQKERRRV